MNGAFEFPASCHGSVPGGFGTPADAYFLHVPERSRVVFEVDNGLDDWMVSLLADIFDGQGNYVNGASAPYGATHRVGGVIEEESVMRFELDGFSFGEPEIPYTFRARLEPPPPPLAPQDDCGTGGDAGGGWQATPRLALPITCVGELRWTGDIDGYGMDTEDRYRVDVEPAQTLHVRALVPPGSTLCAVLWGQHDDDTQSQCAFTAVGADPQPLTADFFTEIGGSADVIAYLESEANVTYSFEASVSDPIWHTQVETAHVVAGAPNVGSPMIGPSRELGPLTVPDGISVEWIPLEARVQPAGSVEMEWTSPVPVSNVRLVLLDEDAPSGTEMRCSTTSPQRVVCDRETNRAFPQYARAYNLRWAGIVVETGVEIDATLTFRHYERAS